MNWKNKKILVTGGLGFIGSNLVIRLVKLGADVTIVDAKIKDTGSNYRNIQPIAKDVRVVELNIADPSLKTHLKHQEFIFNLAGVLSHVDAMVDPVRDLQINTLDQLKFLLAVMEVNPQASIIYTGTRNQYGRAKYLPVTEDHPFDPIDTNGISEIAGEMYHMLYGKLKGLKTTRLRLCNVFGPRHQMHHSRQGVLNWFIRQILDGQTVQLMDGGTQIRDCVFVFDLVDALLLLAANKKVWGHAFNIGAYPVSLLQFVTAAIQIHGQGRYETVPFSAERKIIEPGNYIANWEKLNQFTGWQPKYSLKEAIKETFKFYQLNQKYYWP